MADVRTDTETESDTELARTPQHASPESSTELARTPQHASPQSTPESDTELERVPQPFLPKSDTELAHTPQPPYPRFNLPHWFFHKQLGLKHPNQPRQRDVHAHLYSKTKLAHGYQPNRTVNQTSQGGIFNFDFSTDGSLLVAACERKCFMVFDPLNGKLLGTKLNAHNDCVNYVRFLDSRTFATCSDDTTVKLWDSRYIKYSIRTLHGHSNWVKNIEFDHNSSLLVTSGFDGSVYSWDINNYAENGTACKRVFHTNGLMRTKLTPDGSKLIVSTAGGYLMIIHDLDLTTLSEDLRGFKPNMYRMMQMSQSPIRHGYMYNHVFRGRRNRVEFVTDFPEGNDAEVLSSLQVHPQGWAVATRNISSDENSEWTCLHDIQSYPADQCIAGEDDNEDCYSDSVPYSEPNSASHSRSASPSFFLSIAVDDESGSSAAPSPSYPRSPAASTASFTVNVMDSSDSTGYSASIPQQSTEQAVSTESLDTTAEATVNPNPISLPEIQLSGEQSPEERNAGSSRTRNTFTYITNSRHDSTFLHLLKPSAKQKTIRIYENRPRLQYYIEEPNVGRGFIKVMSFSRDGRVICSPFAYGARILALDERCSELCDVYSDKPKPFREIQACSSHKNVVLSTKFSPTHCLFVSGCLSGEVMFHQPVL